MSMRIGEERPFSVAWLSAAQVPDPKRSDILAITLARDAEDLARFVNREVEGIEGIGGVTWTLGYRIAKHLYGRCAIVD